MNHFMVFDVEARPGTGCSNGWPAGAAASGHRAPRPQSGKQYLTPVNYALVDGEVYCTAGFGPRTDWYRNILADPNVRLWLPQGWRCGPRRG